MIPGRRFVNLMMKDLRVGGSYWLSRMRAEKNLFYSSAGEALMTEPQGASRDSHKRMCESTTSFSSPDFRFKSSRSHDSALGFMPFYGDDGGGPKEGRILVSDSAGYSFMYDAAEGSSEMLPPTKEPSKSNSWHSPISLCVAGAQGSVRPDTLYAINASNSTNFKSLAYHCRGDTMAWDWLDLPPPPYTANEDPAIRSYALLEDDKTICFSSVTGGRGFGTYCFDTATHEWAKAGTWTLPLVGRALRVPQLHNLYFGFLNSDPESLVALELPSPQLAPPEVLHRWPGFGPTDNRGGEWSLMDSNLLYLGNHRFCAAKFFGIYNGSVQLSENLADMAAVLTGVEILDGKADKAKLQMIKHKTTTYIFEGCSIEAVL